MFCLRTVDEMWRANKHVLVYPQSTLEDGYISQTNSYFYAFLAGNYYEECLNQTPKLSQNYCHYLDLFKIHRKQIQEKPRKTLILP